MKPYIKKIKPKPKKGRPTKYRKIFAVRAAKLCKLGATDRHLADFFCVSTRTLTLWMKIYPDFSLTIKEARSLGNASVVRSLRERALGYDYEDTDIRVIDGKIVETKVIRHQPPDTSACRLWLLNRAREQWTDTTRLAGVAGEPVEVAVEQRPLKNIPSEKLEALIDAATASATVSNGHGDRH